MCRKYKHRYSNPISYVMHDLEQRDYECAQLTDRVLSLEQQLKRAEERCAELMGGIDTIKDIFDPKVKHGEHYDYIACELCFTDEGCQKIAKIFGLPYVPESTIYVAEKETEEPPEVVVGEVATDE